MAVPHRAQCRQQQHQPSRDITRAQRRRMPTVDGSGTGAAFGWCGGADAAAGLRAMRLSRMASDKMDDSTKWSLLHDGRTSADARPL